MVLKKNNSKITNYNELPRSKLRGINPVYLVLLLAASRGELDPEID